MAMQNPVFKRCKVCQEDKPVEEFYMDSTDSKGIRRRPLCRLCYDYRTREYFRKSGGRKRYDVKYRYGIEYDEYLALLKTQDNACALCGQKFIEGSRRTSTNVDHNHTTGSVRGLLCVSCNTTVGTVESNWIRLFDIVEYIVVGDIR